MVHLFLNIFFNLIYLKLTYFVILYAGNLRRKHCICRFIAFITGLNIRLLKRGVGKRSAARATSYCARAVTAADIA